MTKRNRISILALVILLFTGELAAQKFEWAKRYSGEGEDAGMGLAIGPSGDVYMCGYFGGIATFEDINVVGYGVFDVFLARFSPDGVLKWVSHAGSVQMDKAMGLAINQNEEIYLTGYFNGTMQLDQQVITSSGKTDIFIAKYDEIGKLMWARSAGGSSFDQGSAVALDLAGNVFLTGYFTGQADFSNISISGNAGFSDIFVAKYSASGVCEWVTHGGGPWEDMGTGIDVDKNGEVYVTGFFYDFLLLDECYTTSYGSSDIFLMKLNEQGKCMWATNAGSSTTDEGRNVAEDGKGNVYVTGYYSNPADFGPFPTSHTGYDDVFLAKYDAQGTVQWVRQGGGADLDFSTGLDVDDDGNVYVAGAFDGSADFSGENLSGLGSDIFAVKYDPDGVPIWLKSAGEANGDFGYAIAKSGSDKVYVCGWYYFISVFDDFELELSNNSDIFLAKLDDKKVGRELHSEIDNVLIYFNDNQKKVVIHSPDQLLKSVRMQDIAGRECIHAQIANAQKEYSLNTSGVSAGVYFIQVGFEKETISRKIVVY